MLEVIAFVYYILSLFRVILRVVAIKHRRKTFEFIAYAEILYPS